MSSAPADLLQFRTDVRNATGLGPVDVGIVGDGAHQRTGGYHEGADVLRSIGRFHAPASANVGSGGEDYSARQARDRSGLTDSASGTDVGSQWPNGGRVAWLRWNNLLYLEMRDRPQNLPALRAVNICLDGRTKLRYDQLHRGQGLIPSTDTVDSHTHLELWRDTEGRRQPTLDRLVALMRAAVTGTTAPPAAQEDDDMTNTWTQPLTQGAPGYAGQQRDTALAFAWMAAGQAAAGVDKLLAAAAGDQARDEALLAAIKALTAGGSVEAAPIIAAVNAVGDKVGQQVLDLQARIAELEAELQQARQAQHAAAQAEADATADKAA